MKHSLLRLVGLLIALAMMSLIVSGQGTNSSLSGVVSDPNGAVIAGATVTVKNNATGAEFKAVTASNGTFTVPTLGAGTYTVTVSMSGFKQAVVNDVTLNAGVPGTVNVDLQVGNASESVVVQGGGEVLQTQSANVSTTLSTAQLAQLPLQSRNTIYFLTLLPGVSSSGTASPRNSIINGLPSSTYNITIDGLNTQDNFNKNGDGFFSYINPTVDAVQEVTISTATPGAESSGQGAIQIKFVTRSGNNEYHGSLYHYHRNPSFNSNYWYTNRDVAPYDVQAAKTCVNGTNTITGAPGPTTVPLTATQKLYDPNTCQAPKAVVLFNQFGGRIGGPITIPKLFNGKDKAFFFVNAEEFRLPAQVSRNRTILNPLTQTGVFQYTAGGTTRTVNLLTLAAANGQTATIDPTVEKLLGDIRTASTSTGGISQNTDPNLQTFSFNNGGMQRRYFPTVRFDFNLTSKHHLENTWNYQRYVSDPDTLNGVDPAFPGFPNHGSQNSNRFTNGITLRSTLTSNIVNEARFGLTGGSVLFFADITATQFANQGGFNLGIGAAGITSATVATGPQLRNAPIFDFADTVTWTRGAHSFTFGGQLTQAGLWINDDVVVPSISFGIVTGSPSDPADAMFNTTNFPNASATNLAAARGIYAVLTGRVSAINANAVLDENTNKYGYQANQVQRARQRDLSFFGQDTWRVRPNLTLTGGLRWELQFPFTVQNGIYSTSTVAGLYGVSGPNLFKPGTLTGSPTQFTNLPKGSRLSNMQWNNVAPSVGFAWTPAAKSGLLKRLIGDGGQTVIRGGYSIAYNRQGSASVTSFFSANPGIFFSANRNATLGNLVTGTGTDVFPLLLRQTTRLGPPTFPSAPTYPFTGQITDQVNIFDPDLKVPYTQSWTLGIQREITKDMAVEVRYVHTWNLQQWSTYQYNEINVVENGFLNEFKLAQANLQANIAAGRCFGTQTPTNTPGCQNNFRYFGAGTGTSPLPTYLAYLAGLPAAQAGTAANYASTNFGSTTFTNPLALQNPSPTGAASGLFNTAQFRTNAAAAGLPANLFVVNPGLLGAPFTQSNGGYSRYDGLQVDLRRRMSKGLLLATNYTFGKGMAGTRYSFRSYGWVNGLSTANGGTIKHAFKANWIYELPIGKGKMLLGNPSGFVGGLVDKVIGGWQWDGTARIQSGANINLGNVRLVGMTREDVQKAFKVRFDDAARRVFIYPQDIIDNTILAFSTSATTTNGYAGAAPTGRYFAPANSPNCIQVVTGDCAGQTLFVQGPRFTRFDLSMIKTFKFSEKWNFEFRAELLNAFNNINFLGNGNTGPSSNQAFGQQVLGNSYRDVNNTQDPGGRLIQLVARINF